MKIIMYEHSGCYNNGMLLLLGFLVLYQLCSDFLLILINLHIVTNYSLSSPFFPHPSLNVKIP